MLYKKEYTYLVCLFGVMIVQSKNTGMRIKVISKKGIVIKGHLLDYAGNIVLVDPPTNKDGSKKIPQVVIIRDSECIVIG